MEEKREDFVINEGLTLSKLIEQVEKYNKGEITTEEFNKWGNELIIISSLPMTKKVNIITDIVERHVYNNMEMKEFLVCELYRNIFFYLYLGGYLGIFNIDPEDINYANYDLLEPIFGPWIEQTAGRDIKQVKEMITLSLQFYNTAQLSEALESVSLEELEEATKSNKTLISTLNHNRDTIKDLKDIQTMNSPLVKDLVENIEAKALKEL